MTEQRLRFSFDGKEIEAEPGQSIGAALIHAGRRSWRRTRFGAAPRGVFCGIGVCFDCLVTVDGVANRRACVTEVVSGAQVRTQEGAGRADLTC